MLGRNRTMDTQSLFSSILRSALLLPLMGSEDEMVNVSVAEIEAVLTEVDTLLRRRLRRLTPQVDHLILAVAPDGAGMIRSNCTPESLRELADLLVSIADGVAPLGATPSD